MFSIDISAILEGVANIIADQVTDKVIARLQHLQVEPKEDKALLTSEEVCTMLNISKPTLNRHIKTRKLIAKKIGKKNYFLAEHIKQFSP